MFLVNWLESNILMIFTTVVLVGIPVVILAVAFSKKSDNTPEGGQ